MDKSYSFTKCRKKISEHSWCPKSGQVWFLDGHRPRNVLLNMLDKVVSHWILVEKWGCCIFYMLTFCHLILWFKVFGFRVISALEFRLFSTRSKHKNCLTCHYLIQGKQWPHDKLIPSPNSYSVTKNLPSGVVILNTLCPTKIFLRQVINLYG